MAPMLPGARAALRLLRKATERGPEPAPTSYVNEHGQKAQWVPPTSSGRFLTSEEMAAQAKRATEAALEAHFSSPEYRKWLRKNHHRMQMVDLADDKGRELTFSDDED